MKLTKKNTPEVWEAMLKFLKVKDIMIIEEFVLYAKRHHMHLVFQNDDASNFSDVFRMNNTDFANCYADASNWKIIGYMSIDELAYHLHYDINKARHEVLTIILKALIRKGRYVTIENDEFKASCLEEIMLKNDMEVA